MVRLAPRATAEQGATALLPALLGGFKGTAKANPEGLGGLAGMLGGLGGWYASTSEPTHTRLAANPEEWAHYHTMYRQLRESWPVVPFKEEIRWLSEREGLVVGDFGCGEAQIATAIADRHQVHSFDHVAIDRRVIACDMGHVPLESGALDVAIFCLALMGSNCTDYVREAHRCLRLDGQLHIWEPASYFEDVAKFCSKLATATSGSATTPTTS